MHRVLAILVFLHLLSFQVTKAQTLHRFHPRLGNLPSGRAADVFPVGPGRVWVRQDMPFYPTLIQGDTFRIYNADQTLLNPYSNPTIGAFAGNAGSTWLVFNRLPGWVEGGFGNSNGGLMRFQNGVFTLFNSLNFPLFASLREKMWYSAAMQPGGQKIWIAGDSGIRSIDLGTFQIRRYFNDPVVLRAKAYWRRGISSKTGVWFHRDNYEWAYQKDEQMEIFQNARFGLADSLRLVDVAFLGTDTLFLTLDRLPKGTSRLWRRNGQTSSISLNGKSVKHLATEEDQILWLAGDSGLFAYRNAQLIAYPQFVPTNKTLARLAIDPSGTKWIATLDSGLYRLSNLKASIQLPNGKKQSYCYNAPVQFQAQVSTIGTNSQFSYLWFFGDGSSSTQPNPSHFYKWTGRFRIRLKVTDGLGASIWLQDSLQLDFVPPLVMYPNKDTLATCSTADLKASSGEKVRWHLPDGSVVDTNLLRTSLTGMVWFEAPPSTCRNRDTIQIVRLADRLSQIQVRDTSGKLVLDTLISILPVTLQATEVPGFCSATWRLNGADFSTQTKPFFVVTEEGKYDLEVESSSVLNCKSSGKTSFFVKRPKDQTIGIPSLITPNGDGKNEVFFIQNLGFYPNHRLQIFNRWGARLLDSTNYQNDWSGDPGVYFYHLEIAGKEWKGWLLVNP